jgi:hypothetical protein
MKIELFMCMFCAIRNVRGGGVRKANIGGGGGEE